MIEKTDTFIIKTNFYFIVDFCKDREYKGKLFNFYSLSPINRVLLSVYLTGLIGGKFKHRQNNVKKTQQMMDIIFNFNGKKKRQRNDLNMLSEAKEMIEHFLLQFGDYCEYVNQEKIRKELCSEDLFKISMNPTEFLIVYKMGFKKVEYILHTIYILDTARNQQSCAHLNKFDLHNFSKSLKNSKVIVDKLFGFMEWKYIAVNKSMICWKSKWKMKLNTNDLSEEEQIEKKISELIKDE